MAAEGTSLGSAAGMMALFGAGASVPILLVAYVSRRIFVKRRWIQGIQGRGKLVFGVILIVFGITTLTGADKAFEALLVEHLPDWLLDISTKF